MYTVYVLQDKNGKLYKGCTSNLARRFREHTRKAGGRTTSKIMKKLEIIFTEDFNSFKEARSREVYFKSAAGRRFLKTKLRS